VARLKLIPHTTSSDGAYRSQQWHRASHGPRVGSGRRARRLVGKLHVEAGQIAAAASETVLALVSDATAYPGWGPWSEAGYRSAGDGSPRGPYGKDLGLEVALADGRRLQICAGDVAVSADGAVVMQLERVDDRNLKIRYAGPGLEIRSMRVRFPAPNRQEELITDVRAFLADGNELSYCVDANITLAALPDSLAHHGDPQ
jgi:hypothetical protein